MQYFSIRNYSKSILCCALALVAYSNANGAPLVLSRAEGLVRRAVTRAVSNRVTKTMAKPVSWPINKIAQTQFYKKHPWLVKGAGMCLAIVAAKKALDSYEARQPRALRDAAVLGKLAKIKALIKAGAQLDIKDEEDRTALHYAALNGHSAIVQALINAKADLNVQDNNGDTALHCAAFFNHSKIIQALITAQADLNMQDHHGSAALHFAAYNGHLATVQALIDADAGIDADEINQLANKYAVWKIIKKRRQEISTEIDNATGLNPKDISSLITDYLVPERPTNTPTPDESDDEDATPIRAPTQVEARQNHQDTIEGL